MRLAAAGRIALIGLVATLALTSCSSTDTKPGDASNANGLEKTDLLIGQYPGADSAPLFIAIERGFFKEQGLNVKTEAIQAPQAVLPKLSNGSMDVVLGSYATILTIQSEGLEKFKYIADSYQGAAGAFGIMVRRDSPIKKVADLKGKKIGVNALKGLGVLTMNPHLKIAGLDPTPGKDIQYVEVPTTNWLTALQKGDVDAVWMTDPYVSEAKNKLGATMLVDTMSGPTESLPITGWAATEKWVAANPRTMGAFQRAMAKAQNIAATDRSAVTKILPTFTKIPAATAATINLGNYPTTLSAQRIQRVADLMVEYGFIKSKIDVAPMIVTSQG
ncbi:ABC transporter substrate-binding protein [Nonomuraea rhodomycinica]|uniref:ABC transporter substrate-binding protein n=1 Tax=Nonomuraea rhodomycinica TaxID=1712872 RepID=A0A7Y6MHF9_9ACTN|nr:ABC transporter substrate-binding protein [Nonomuraea rhodomycinica]NUW46939.1 ABC transporter substrate-binding protein [Nonomuraea rhodomycinica]